MPIKSMNRKYGNLIGETIGKVHDVDVDTDNIGWGSYLQVRVDIPLSKSLTKGCFLHVNGERLDLKNCQEFVSLVV